MNKTAFVFPGQGSQFVGMGKEWLANPISAEYFERANQALGFDLKKIILEGPDEDLNRTLYTQPALVTVSLAHFAVLSSEGKTPDVLAGHSLGEYSALVVAEALAFEDAVKLVHLRAKLMEEAVQPGLGAMAAVIGMSETDILSILKEINGIAEIANFNSPEQIVISGETAAIARAVELLAAKGAKKVVPLKVSGPFHSSMIQSAGIKLKEALSQTEIHKPKIPVIANVSADYYQGPEEIREFLSQQVYSSVRWTQTVQRMLADGVSEFVECGPGKVLTGLIRRIKV